MSTTVDRQISPSKIRLAQLCAFPWSPEAPAWPSIPSGSDANYGTAVHAAAECLAVFGDAPIADIVEHYQLTPSEARDLQMCASHVKELLERERPDVEWRTSEVTLAFDRATGTARELPAQHSRDYSDAKPSEIPGSMDLVLRRRSTGLLVVRDWKTGHNQREDLDARTDPQLLTYALMAQARYGGDQVAVQIAHVSPDGVRIDEVRFDTFDLDIHRAELEALLAEVKKPSEPRPGEHCTRLYCPAVSVCPVSQKAIAEVDAEATPEHPFSPEITSPEHAASLYRRIQLAKKAIEHVEHALKEYVRKAPVEVEPGVFYGAVECKGKERIEAEVAGAVELIRRHLGDAADIALEVKTSKAGLERGARHMLNEKGEMERGALKRVVDPLLEDLRQHGALKQGPDYTEIKTFKKKGGDK